MDCNRLSDRILTMACAFCAIASCGAAGSVPVPHALSAGSVTHDSFVASWKADGDAESFLLDCWEEAVTEWSGDIKWADTFERCTNTTQGIKTLAGKFDLHTDIPGWSGEYVYAPEKGTDGIIQINKNSGSVGWLVSPELPALGAVELVVRARAKTKQNDNVMPVFLISNGVTNDLASFELATSFSECHCSLNNVTAGDRLAFKSFSVGSYRAVLIDEISLVDAFVPGSPVTNHVLESRTVGYSDAPQYKVEGLAPGRSYAFSVRAVSGGATSEPSEVCKVETSLQVDAAGDGAWSGATASELAHTSFRLDWPEFPGAAAYRVSVWTNVQEGASAGQVVFVESFSRAEASESTTAIANSDTFNDDYADHPGWEIVSNVYRSVDSGSVRIGNTSKPGELKMPSMQIAENSLLRVRARRQDTDVGAIFSLWLNSSGTLREIGEACEIGVGMTECLWALPAITAEERLVFRSASGKKSSYRTILDEVEIVEGFLAGVPVPHYAVDAAETERLFFDAADLQPAAWMYSVEAVDDGGNVLAASTNEVDLVNLPPSPVIDAVAMSGISRSGGMRIWREDFGSLASLFPDRDKNSASWLNGVSLPHWQAYGAGAGLTNITRNTGAGTKRGLYAYWTENLSAPDYSLGALTTKDSGEYVFGLVFRNDTAFAARKVAIAYDGVLFGLKNESEQKLLCECLVTNELVSVAAENGWQPCEELDFYVSAVSAEIDLPAKTAISSEVPGASIPKDSYFVLRWRRCATSSAAAMAIDNLAVSFAVQPRPMTIVVR